MSKKLFIAFLTLLAIIPFALAASPSLYNCGSNPLSPNTPTQCFANTVAYHEQTTWCGGATGSALANNDAAAVGANCDSIADSHGNVACDRQETSTPYCKDGKGVLVLDMGVGQEIINNHNDWDLIVGEGGAQEPYVVSVSVDGKTWISLGKQCGSAQVNIPEQYANQKFRYIQFTADGKQKTCDGLTTVPPENYGADIDFVMARTIPCSGNLCPTPAPKPTCDFAFHPNTVTLGEEASFTLNTNDAHSYKVVCSTPTGAQTYTREVNVIPDEFTFTDSYAIENTQTCHVVIYSNTDYTGKTAACDGSITVNPVPPQTQPACTATFDPDYVLEGDETTLSIATENAKSINVDCGQLDTANADVPHGYTQQNTYAPTASDICTITVYAKKNYAGKSATCEAHVDVMPKPSVPSCSMSYSPDHITSGESSTFAFQTANARSYALNCVDENGQTYTDTQTSITEGYAFSGTAHPTFTESCTLKVFSNEDLLGNYGSCTTSVTVEQTPADHVHLSVPDKTLAKGATVTFDLYEDYTDTNLAEDQLTYTLTGQSQPGIVNCALNSANDLTCTGLAEGQSTINLRVTNGVVKDTDTFVITVTDDHTAIIDLAVPDQTITEGESVSLTLRDYTEYTGSEVHLAFELVSVDNPAIVTCSVSHQASLHCLGNTEGQTVVTLHVTDGLISDTDSFVITVLNGQTAMVHLSVPDQTLQQGDDLDLDLRDFTEYTGNKDDLTYTLTGVDGNSVSCSLTPQSALHCTGLTEGLATVHLAVTDGSVSDTDNFSITVSAKPTSHTIATFNQGSICQGSATSLHVAVRDPQNNVEAITWDFGDGSSPASGETVSHTYETTGTYPVTITLEGDSGIISTIHQDVIVGRCTNVHHDLDIASSFVDNGVQTNVAEAGDTIDVYAFVENTGNQRENVHLSATIPALGIEEQAPSFVLTPKEGKWSAVTITLPEDLKAGSYTVELVAKADKTKGVGYITFQVV